MKFILLIFLLFSSLLTYTQDLVILHTNDMHSHLNGFAPEAEYTPLTKDKDLTLGGFARIAGFINQEKNKNQEKLLVLDAGDFIMGTLFHTIEPKRGFQLNLMHQMGYDYVAIGNHEFDYGLDQLTNIIKNNQQLGEIPQLLLSNRVKGDDKTLDRFNSLYENGTILPYDLIEKNGKKIGIFSLMGIDAEESIPSIYQLKFEKLVRTARKTSRYLKKQGADLVVVLSHTGLLKTENGNWEGEDYKLGKAINDIDLIISGHSHSELATPLQAGNTLIVQTGEYGQKVGRIEVSFDAQGKALFQYTLVPMNDEIPADKSIQDKINQQVQTIQSELLNQFKIPVDEVIFETKFDLIKDEQHPSESNLGPFVADAIYNAVYKVDPEGLDLAIVGSGVIRNNIIKGKNGKQNIADIFNIMPLGRGLDSIPGSPLGKFFTTGYELKKVLELILAVAPKHPHSYLYFSGAEIDYDPNKRIFNKISDIRLGNHQDGFKSISLDKKDTQLYSIAANVYMIGFIDKLKKMSFGLVNVTPKDKKGHAIEVINTFIDFDPEQEGLQETKEWLVVYNYIKSFIDLDGNQIPEMPQQYRNAKNPLYEIN